jgi:sulfoxide reductase heme-binding subunit YedZ
MSPRLARRLWRHHLPLAMATGLCSFALYVTRPYPDVLTRLSFATAWPALVLLSVTLIIGPWQALRRRPYALSQDLRRDIGIWAGSIGMLHAGIGQCVHLRGRPWLYYIYEKWQVMPVRYDVFGLSNHTGLVAALILLVLLATSNDMALRRLGLTRWKSWQRWNYACFGLAALHTFGYLLGIESPRIPMIAAAVLCLLVTITLQTWAWRRKNLAVLSQVVR